MIQLDDDSFIATAYSYETNKTNIITSLDGLSWEEQNEINRMDDASVHQVDGKLTIIYQKGGRILKSTLNDSFEMSSPSELVEESEVGFESLFLESNILGIFFSLDVNFQYDVFYKEYIEE